MTLAKPLIALSVLLACGLLAIRLFDGEEGGNAGGIPDSTAVRESAPPEVPKAEPVVMPIVPPIRTAAERSPPQLRVEAWGRTPAGLHRLRDEEIEVLVLVDDDPRVLSGATQEPPPGSDLRIEVRAEGYVPQRTELHFEGKGKQRVRLELDALASIDVQLSGSRPEAWVAYRAGTHYPARGGSILMEGLTPGTRTSFRLQGPRADILLRLKTPLEPGEVRVVPFVTRDQGTIRGLFDPPQAGLQRKDLRLTWPAGDRSGKEKLSLGGASLMIVQAKQSVEFELGPLEDKLIGNRLSVIGRAAYPGEVRYAFGHLRYLHPGVNDLGYLKAGTRTLRVRAPLGPSSSKDGEPIDFEIMLYTKVLGAPLVLVLREQIEVAGTLLIRGLPEGRLRLRAEKGFERPGTGKKPEVWRPLGVEPVKGEDGILDAELAWGNGGRRSRKARLELIERLLAGPRVSEKMRETLEKMRERIQREAGK